MSKINPIAVDTASEAVRPTLEMVEAKLGRVPNMYRVMANSQAVLSAYVSFNSALSKGSISSKLAESIALATAEFNTCSYCLSAHTVLGKKAGLTDAQMIESRCYTAEDQKNKAALMFTKILLENPSKIESKDIEQLREVNFTDGEILEIISNVVRNMLTNYINIVAETPVDWPEIVKPLYVKPSENDYSNLCL